MVFFFLFMLSPPFPRGPAVLAFNFERQEELSNSFPSYSSFANDFVCVKLSPGTQETLAAVWPRAHASGEEACHSQQGRNKRCHSAASMCLALRKTPVTRATTNANSFCCHTLPPYANMTVYVVAGETPSAGKQEIVTIPTNVEYYYCL